MCTHWICFPWKVVVSKTCPLIFRDHFAEAGIRGSLRASFLSLTSKFLSSCLKPSQFLCLSLLSSPSILSNVIFAIVQTLPQLPFLFFFLEKAQYKECEAFWGVTGRGRFLMKNKGQQALKFQWESLKVLDIIFIEQCLCYVSQVRSGPKPSL